MRELEIKGTVGGDSLTLCPLSMYTRGRKACFSIENEWTLSLVHYSICAFVTLTLIQTLWQTIHTQKWRRRGLSPWGTHYQGDRLKWWEYSLKTLKTNLMTQRYRGKKKQLITLGFRDLELRVKNCCRKHSICLKMSKF